MYKDYASSLSLQGKGNDTSQERTCCTSASEILSTLVPDISSDLPNITTTVRTQVALGMRSHHILDTYYIFVTTGIVV